MNTEFAKICRANLIAIATAYGRATGASLEQISKTFYGKSSFLRELVRNKRSVSIDKFDELIGSFAKEWPEGAEWPLTRAIIIPKPSRRTDIPKNGKLRA